MRFMIRHRATLQDLALLIVSVLVAAFVLLQVDVFVGLADYSFLPGVACEQKNETALPGLKCNLDFATWRSKMRLRVCLTDAA